MACDWLISSRETLCWLEGDCLRLININNLDIILLKA